MDALNTLRAVLVAVSFVAAVMLAFDGQWTPAALLGVGIAAHLALFGWLRAQKRKAREADPLAELGSRQA